jgi:polyisoprenoid-binding protein YceI
MKSILLTLLAATPVLFGQEAALELDPAQTHVEYTLGAVLHTVHGTFQLKRGSVHYDLASGKASGEIVLDARSGQSGNDSRDRKMHKSILESDRYTDIVFVPDRVEGGLAKANLHGTFRIHGQDHEMTITVESKSSDGRLEFHTHFEVPYVQWGMKNPSTLLLRVGDKVDIEIQGAGKISRPDGHPLSS